MVLNLVNKVDMLLSWKHHDKNGAVLQIAEDKILSCYQITEEQNRSLKHVHVHF